MILIAQGPKVTVAVTCEESYLLKVDLSLNEEGFCCHITGANRELEKQLLDWLQAYARKTSLPPLPVLSHLHLPSYSKRVLACVRAIEFGKKASYQDIAIQAGNPLASRAVGTACHRNPFPLFIPCHRVVKKDGTIGGFALDLTIKSRLLDFELI